MSKPTRKYYNSDEQYIKALNDYIELLEQCRDYDASGKNMPVGYILPRYEVGKRIEGINKPKDNE